MVGRSASLLDVLSLFATEFPKTIKLSPIPSGSLEFPNSLGDYGCTRACGCEKEAMGDGGDVEYGPNNNQFSHTRPLSLRLDG